MLTQSQTTALCKTVLNMVKAVDAKLEAAVTIWSTRRAHTRFALNEITTAGENSDVQLTLEVQLGLRSAFANTNQVEPTTLRSLVQRTVSNARLAPELPETMPLLGPTKLSKSAIYDGAMAALDSKALAQGIAAAIAPARNAGLIAAGFFEVHDGLMTRLTTAGQSLAYPATEASFSMTARTKDGTGSGWNGLGTRKRVDLDFVKVGTVAVQKAVASAKPKALDPGRYTVVLEPAAVRELFQFVASALNRRAADEGRSAFTGKLGEKIVSDRVTFFSDPQTSSIGPYDGEGFPLAARTWIQDGVLKSLEVSRFWAKKQGLQPTGSYDGFEMRPGDATRPQLLSGIKRGVLISRLWYTNLVDPKTMLITGLTRDGTFLIEDGVITAPVKNFRINQSVIDALAKVDAVSLERESPGLASWKFPALRTHEFLLASQSDAI